MTYYSGLRKDDTGLETEYNGLRKYKGMIEV